MKNNYQSITLALLGGLLLPLSSLLAAAQDELARVDISGTGKDQVEMEIVSFSPEAKVTHADWLPADQQKKAIVAHFPAKKEWQEGVVTIKPAKSGNISISLLGPYVIEQAGSKKLRCIQMDFDCVEGDTAVFKNGGFEKKENDDRAAWWNVSDVATSNPPVDDSNRARVMRGGGKEGEHFIRVWHNSRISQTVFVEAGTPLTLKFYYRQAEK